MPGAAPVHIVHIPLDVLIAVFQRFGVPVEKIKVPRYDGDCAGPVQSVVGPVAPAPGRDDVGKDSVGLLLVPVVCKPFLVYGDAVIVVKGCLDSQVSVSGPPVLLTLRTVRRISHQVGEISHVGGLPQPVYKVIGGTDFSRRIHIAVHRICHKGRVRHLHRAVSHQLHIPESLVVEPGHELVLAFPAEGHHICLEDIPAFLGTEIHIDVGKVGMPVGAEPFSMDKLHHSPFLA